MTRSYAPSDIVPLPRLGVSDAIALGATMVTRAHAAGPLPPLAASACTRMEDAYDDLRVAAQSRVLGAESSAARETDRVVDATWSATHQWCLGWCRLPPLPRHIETLQVANTLRDRLFADGVKFTMLKFRVQWVESQTRLDIVENEDLAPLFARLGGTPLLEALKEAHDAYGKALGITAVGDDEVPTASLRDLLSVFLDALRRYVIQVSAHADQDDVEAQELADALLAPLMTWQSTPVTSSEQDADDTDDSGDTDGGTPNTSTNTAPADTPAPAMPPADAAPATPA
jgi:hypothetical protein